MVVHSKNQVSGNTSFNSKQRSNTNRNPETTLNYIPCSQINLHHSAIPTAHFYQSIEQNDDVPFITFAQEPYCYKGKPKHLPGNGVTFYHSSPNLTNPRATLTVSNSLANQFFFQKQFSGRDISTCSIELPTSILYVSSVYMETNSSCEPPDKFIKLAEHCLAHKPLCDIPG